MSILGSEQSPLHVAVVGSGPSGFYSTEALLRSDIAVRINMFERLASPYGLVRSGVAPDHPKLKQAIQVYAKIAESPNYNFIGNVTVGGDITVEELCATHHAIIFTCGAETDRKLGIPGEELKGSYTATEFVGWYNGHPDYRDRKFDLSHESAVIIGQGNVAADVSRILSKSVDALKNTDISEHALEVLADSKIKHIYVVGRRGPVQAKFTSKELKEFGDLDICTPVVEQEELVLNPESEIELADKNNSATKKVYGLFKDFSSLSEPRKARCCHFTFLKSPNKLIGINKMEKIVFEKNKLVGEPFRQSARGTGEFIELEAGILFRSIGYRGIPIPGIPFDDDKGIFPNAHGRIIDAKGQTLLQLYTAGWIKRGPTGIIGTNRADSVETVNSLLEDITLLDTGKEKSGAEGIYEFLNNRKIRYINFIDWKKIDQVEIERGQLKDKPREKFTSIEDMITVLD